MSDLASGGQRGRAPDRRQASGPGSSPGVNVTPVTARDALARTLFPADGSSARAVTLAGLVVVAAAVAVLRLGARGMNTLWAEDGKVFYQGAMRSSLPFVFFQPYRGYMHAAPRVIAAVAALFPVTWAASSIAIGDAIALGLLAAVVYRAARVHIQNRWLRLVPALLIAACPTGPETVGSIAGLQWVLFFAAFVVLLWNPRRALPIAAGAITVLLATMTSPFGFLFFPIAAARVIVFPRSRAAVIPLFALAGTGIQALITATATGRTIYGTILVGRLARLFIVDVAGQGFFGTRYPVPWAALGAVAVLVTGLAWALIAVMGVQRQFAVGSLALAYSICFFATSAVVGGITAGQPVVNRYFAGPLLLMAFAVVVLLDGALGRQNRFRWTETCRPVAIALCAGLLICLGYSAVTSWRVSDPARSAPTWSAALDRAREQCSRGARRATVQITPKWPPHWYVVLTCAEIEQG